MAKGAGADPAPFKREGIMLRSRRRRRRGRVAATLTGNYPAVMLPRGPIPGCDTCLPGYPHRCPCGGRIHGHEHQGFDADGKTTKTLVERCDECGLK